MKKFALALMCAVSVLLMASCTKKTEVKYPTIKFVNAGAGYVYENTTIDAGTPVAFKIEAVATDAKDLLASVSFKLIYNNETVGDTTITLKDQTTYTLSTDPEPMILPGLYTFEATTATKAGRTATAKVNVTVNEVVAEADFEWYRQGGNPGLGLEMFGLKWTSNYKEVCAKIVPYNTEYDELRRIDGVNYDDIVDVVAAFNMGTKIDEFHEISCEKPSATYDYVIATHSLKFAGSDRDVYFVMHVTNSTVTVDPVLGSTVTITGRYKWYEVK